MSRSDACQHELITRLLPEIGRPVGALRSATQALLSGADRDAVLRRSLLAGMETELLGMQRLLTTLVDYELLCAESLTPEMVPLDLRTWLPDRLGAWETALTYKEMTLAVTLPHNLPALLTDPNCLSVILDNLLHNAIKYSPRGGSVEIDAGLQDDLVRVQISDSGPGIAVHQREWVFEPFHKLRSDSRFVPGLGLGLTVARALATLVGGRLQANGNAQVAGSRFTLWLPAAVT